MPLLNKHPEDRVFAFIQARQSSERFPNKIYADFRGAPILYHVIDRAKRAKLIDEVLVLSPRRLDDLPIGIKNVVCPTCDLENECRNVLGEFYWALKENPCDYIVRLTADCPLLDPNLIDYIVSQALESSADYCSNVMSLTFPDGVDTEVISSKFLQFMNSVATSRYHREHVTTLIRDTPPLQDEFNCISVENLQNLSNVKISIDKEEELNKIQDSPWT